MLTLSLLVISVALLNGCEEPIKLTLSTTEASSPTPASFAPPSCQPQVVDVDYATVNSWEERINAASMILIGEVSNADGVVNMEHNVDSSTDPPTVDVTRPDPTRVTLGQVYQIEVDSYLKGDGPARLNVVQPEGFLTCQDGPVQPSDIPEALRQEAKAGYPHVPMQIGTQYLFFLEPLQGFPADHVTGARHPWRFTLPQAGIAEAQSPVPEVNQQFSTFTSEELLTKVEQILHKVK